MKKLLNTIYVTNPDSYLSLDGENLVVMREEKKVRMPLHNVERIMTFGYTGASPALMGRCAKDGRELVFMTSSGKFLARMRASELLCQSCGSEEWENSTSGRRQSLRINSTEKRRITVVVVLRCFFVKNIQVAID